MRNIAAVTAPADSPLPSFQFPVVQVTLVESNGRCRDTDTYKMSFGMMRNQKGCTQVDALHQMLKFVKF
jgi:hypothetical protein